MKGSEYTQAVAQNMRDMNLNRILLMNHHEQLLMNINFYYPNALPSMISLFLSKVFPESLFL